ncbi:MAG: nitroreductase family protein [Flavobacteriia bacterium]|nr:MAG: nitroreductase family protein [Flavobacteriia bacterium]
MNLKETLNYRRSVRVYDPEKEIDTEKVKQCIQQATLAPNSSNMQLWEFYHITSKDVLQQLSNACFDQLAARTAKQMVVFVVRKDLWKKRAQANLNFIQNANIKYADPKREKLGLDYYKKLIPIIYSEFLGIWGYLKYFAFYIAGWFRPIYRQVRRSDMRIVAHKSVGLAAQTFMLSMAELKYDTCPMEGFDSKLIKKALKLPRKAEINMVISCGIRLPEGVYGDRFRIPFDEVYFKN